MGVSSEGLQSFGWVGVVLRKHDKAECVGGWRRN
jgi:hypothetical protein